MASYENLSDTEVDPRSLYCDAQVKTSTQNTSNEMFALATQANSNDFNNTQSQFNSRGRGGKAMPTGRGTYSSSQHHLQNQIRL